MSLEDPEKPTRRRFLQGALAAVGSAAMPHIAEAQKLTEQTKIDARENANRMLLWRQPDLEGLLGSPRDFAMVLKKIFSNGEDLGKAPRIVENKTGDSSFITSSVSFDKDSGAGKIEMRFSHMPRGMSFIRMEYRLYSDSANTRAQKAEKELGVQEKDVSWSSGANISKAIGGYVKEIEVIPEGIGQQASPFFIHNDLDNEYRERTGRSFVLRDKPDADREELKMAGARFIRERNEGMPATPGTHHSDFILMYRRTDEFLQPGQNMAMNENTFANLVSNSLGFLYNAAAR
jgi:hypothetical protein